MNIWTDEELAILRESWFRGLSDWQIGKLVNRSDKSVEIRRRMLKLTARYYPERTRASSFGVRRTYTEAEDADILARVNNRELIKDIADRYNVSVRAMDNKVERLLEREVAEEPDSIPSERTCLWCGNWFTSKLPKKVNRRCTVCQAITTY